VTKVDYMMEYNRRLRVISWMWDDTDRLENLRLKFRRSSPPDVSFCGWHLELPSVVRITEDIIHVSPPNLARSWDYPALNRETSHLNCQSLSLVSAIGVSTPQDRLGQEGYLMLNCVMRVSLRSLVLQVVLSTLQFQIHCPAPVFFLNNSSSILRCLIMSFSLRNRERRKRICGNDLYSIRLRSSAAVDFSWSWQVPSDLQLKLDNR
jgi:hypothetical protein